MRILTMAFAAVAMLALLSFTLISRADDPNDKITSRGVTGYLVDQACGEKMMAKDKPDEAAAAHSRECAMKEACEKSGYAVISGGKWYKFDEHGNTLAKQYLAKTKEDKELHVTVSGFIKDDTMKVSAIVVAPVKP